MDAIALVMAALTGLIAIGFFRFVCTCMPLDERFSAGAVAVLFATVSLLLLGNVATAQPRIPATAHHYRDIVIRTARAQFGLDAPVATLAAQVQQESAFRARAKSGAGAQGLAQFMPATAKWISDIYPDLGRERPYSPSWALRAMTRYDAWLLARITAVDACNHWAFALAAYNGGLGWVYRDRKLALSKGLNKQVWFTVVEQVNAGRSTANWQQNRDYPQRILLVLAPRFVAAGWGTTVCHAHGQTS